MKKKFHFKSISARWFANSLATVLAVLLAADSAVFLSLREVQTNSVAQYLRGEAATIRGILLYAGDYAPLVRQTISEFDKKDKMELMAISRSGLAVITSSGFTPDPGEPMPDFEEAKRTGEVTEYSGKLLTGERYMAVTALLPDTSAYAAIRLVTSVENVSVDTTRYALLLGFATTLVLTVVTLLGLYFVRSIVSPLRQVGAAAKKLSSGDYKNRIPEPEGDDEIAQLIRVFNNMAAELETSENVKNDFISSVSHELRTPLTAVKGWSETVLESGADSIQFEKGMRVVIAETERLSTMVEELLDFSKIQSGRFTLKKENIDLLAELGEAAMFYKEKARKENKHIEYDEPDAAAVIFGDKNRLRQVFINIIDNAVKYAEHEVVITAEFLTDSIVVTVRDDGRGISEADLPEVKTRFFKGANSVKGSGIGLSVAEEIVSLHDGTLKLTSRLGEGATVTVTLPK
ncbi:MAG: HAMP domain-containing histidine kinase [Oscillospiraceae bacterium]|jgi:signal transduction histidine kinase|nr:HAMP domain-containing histidine kinase [Oscillospiraceae bacterium]